MLIIRVRSKDVAVEICEHGTDSTGKAMERLAWFNYQWLLGPIGYIPPADAEAECYRNKGTQSGPNRLTQTKLPPRYPGRFRGSKWKKFSKARFVPQAILPGYLSSTVKLVIFTFIQLEPIKGKKYLIQF